MNLIKFNAEPVQIIDCPTAPFCGNVYVPLDLVFTNCETAIKSTSVHMQTTQTIILQFCLFWKQTSEIAMYMITPKPSPKQTMMKA